MIGDIKLDLKSTLTKPEPLPGSMTSPSWSKNPGKRHGRSFTPEELADLKRCGLDTQRSAAVPQPSELQQC